MCADSSRHTKPLGTLVADHIVHKFWTVADSQRPREAPDGALAGDAAVVNGLDAAEGGRLAVEVVGDGGEVPADEAPIDEPAWLML